MDKILKNTLSVVLAAMVYVSAVQAGGPVTEQSESGKGPGATGVSDNVSYNFGLMTEYWYRGAFQSDMAINFGADYEGDTFYLGTWWADVGGSSLDDPSLEIDVYGGFNFPIFGVPSYLGVTGYYYTDNFDRDYEEITFGMDFGLFAIDSVINGSYKAGSGSASSDYGFFALIVPLTESFAYSYQTFTGGSIHYMAHELSYSTELSGIDVGVTLGHNNDGGAGASPSNTQDTSYLTLSLGVVF